MTRPENARINLLKKLGGNLNLNDALKKIHELYGRDLGDGIALKIMSDDHIYEMDCNDDSHSTITADELKSKQYKVVTMFYELDYYDTGDVIKPYIEIEIEEEKL